MAWPKARESVKPPAPIPFDQARRLLREAALVHLRQRLESGGAGAVEQLAIGRAGGRVLAQAVAASAPLPGFDNAAMDGFALRGADLGHAAAAGLAIVGERFAGPVERLHLGPGTCARITTGAMLPVGADTVVPRENVEEIEGVMRVSTPVPAGAHVRMAGEDVAIGDCLAAAGTVLDAARLALLAAAGVATVTVARPPRVALLVTGDELRDPATALGPGEIHDSNTPMLGQLFAEAGIEVARLPPLPDDPTTIRAALLDAAVQHDLVVTCGGASVGERDFLPQLAAGAGTRHFWRVRVRPGMPMLCASVAGALLIGLPGNPVSAFCGFLAFVRPALAVLGGRGEVPALLHARLDTPLSKAHDRHELRRGLLRCAPDGTLHVGLHPHQGSHQLSGIAGSNALVHLPPECRALDAGALVAVEPYGAILAG